MLRMNWLGTVNHPRIFPIGTANLLVRLTQEQKFHAAGYPSERIRKIFLNREIDHRRADENHSNRGSAKRP